MTGRRIRHVNHEKKLKDFLENQKELEKEKALKREEKLERRKRKREKLESTHHLFVDPSYDKQKQKISQDLDEAIGKAALVQRKRKLISSADPDTDKPTTSSSEVTTEIAEKILTESNAAEKQAEESTPATSTQLNTLIAKFDSKTSSSEVVVVVAKKKKDTPADSLKGWMGVDDYDVSSSDEEDEEVEPPKSKFRL